MGVVAVNEPECRASNNFADLQVPWPGVVGRHPNQEVVVRDLYKIQESPQRSLTLAS